jgi:hypothetical protein
MEERLDFGAKTGLSNAKFTYEYDSNFRLMGVQGRIGGQSLPEYALAYNIRTGALEQLGQFKVTHSLPVLYRVITVQNGREDNACLCTSER